MHAQLPPTLSLASPSPLSGGATLPILPTSEILMRPADLVAPSVPAPYPSLTLVPELRQLRRMQSDNSDNELASLLSQLPSAEFSGAAALSHLCNQMLAYINANPIINGKQRGGVLVAMRRLLSISDTRIVITVARIIFAVHKMREGEGRVEGMAGMQGRLGSAHVHALSFFLFFTLHSL